MVAYAAHEPRLSRRCRVLRCHRRVGGARRGGVGPWADRCLARRNPASVLDARRPLVSWPAVVFGARLSVARVRPLYAALLLLLPLTPFMYLRWRSTWQGVPAAMLLAGIAVAMVAAEPVAWPGALRSWCSSPTKAPWLATVLAVVVFAFAWKG